MKEHTDRDGHTTSNRKDMWKMGSLPNPQRAHKGQRLTGHNVEHVQQAPPSRPYKNEFIALLVYDPCAEVEKGISRSRQKEQTFQDTALIGVCSSGLDGSCDYPCPHANHLQVLTQ